jgi:DNA-binding NtrC family response regulator
MSKILVVDDELSIRESFSLILEGRYKVLLAASGEVALKHITDQKVDLAFLDIRMPGLDGLETLKRIKGIDPDVEVIMVTAVNDIQKASEAIKLGARDYIVKPFDVEAILKMTDQILRRKQLFRDSAEIRREFHKKTPQLVGQNAKLLEISRLIEKISSQDLRVLVLGEPGTEKETVASIIHHKSPRSDNPLRFLNLSSRMTAGEIRNRILGQGKGSTIVELERMNGLAEEARGGTLFINSAEYLPPMAEDLAAANLRLIGGSSVLDLADRSRELFNYFSEVLIVLPPLRERISDLPLLINYYLEVFNETYGREVKGVAPEVEDILSLHSWPGNIAELEGLLEKIMITIDSEQIGAENLPLDLLVKSAGTPGANYTSVFEQRYVRRVFELSGNNKEKTASVLGINPALIEDKI